MNGKYIVFSLITMASILHSNCCSFKNKSPTLFNVKETYYQSWISKNQVKGTDIVIQLINVQKEVIFDSLVFRGIQLPVFIQKQDDVVTIKTVLSFDDTKFSIDKKVTHKPDQLLYMFQGKRYSFSLKNIRPLPTKYN